jgi:hypothetical protein
VGLQQRPDVDVEHHGVERPALRRIADFFVLRPFVRHRTRQRHHFFQYNDLAVHRLARGA